jgi:hypothetical protein
MLFKNGLRTNFHLKKIQIFFTICSSKSKNIPSVKAYFFLIALKHFAEHFPPCSRRDYITGVEPLYKSINVQLIA